MFDHSLKLDHESPSQHHSSTGLRTNLSVLSNQPTQPDSRNPLRNLQTDHSLQTHDQPYQFWSLLFQEETNPTSSPPDHLSPIQTQFNAAYGSLSHSPDPLFTLDELGSYPSSRNSPRHSTPSSMTEWTISENMQFSMPDTSSSARSKSEPDKAALSLAQSRRRSKNRTAQRAFRERKERHIKELEAKIHRLEEESKSIGGENERLRKEIAQLNNKNLTLRATNNHDNLDHYVEYASWRSKQRRL